MRPCEATESLLLFLQPVLYTKRHYEKVKKACVYKRPSTDSYRHMERVCLQGSEVRKEISCISKLQRPQLQLKTQFSPVVHPILGYPPLVLSPAWNLHKLRATRYVSHIRLSTLPWKTMTTWRVAIFRTRWVLWTSPGVGSFPVENISRTASDADVVDSS